MLLPLLFMDFIDVKYIELMILSYGQLSSYSVELVKPLLDSWNIVEVELSLQPFILLMDFIAYPIMLTILYPNGLKLIQICICFITIQRTQYVLFIRHGL